MGSNVTAAEAQDRQSGLSQSFLGPLRQFEAVPWLLLATAARAFSTDQSTPLMVAIMIVSSFAIFMAFRVAVRQTIQFVNCPAQLDYLDPFRQMSLAVGMVSRVLILCFVAVAIMFAAGKKDDALALFLGLDGIAFDQATVIGIIWSATLATLMLMMVLGASKSGMGALTNGSRILASHAVAMVPAVSVVAAVLVGLHAIQADMRDVLVAHMQTNPTQFAKTSVAFVFVFGFALIRLWLIVGILVLALRLSYRMNEPKAEIVSGVPAKVVNSAEDAHYFGSDIFSVLEKRMRTYCEIAIGNIQVLKAHYLPTVNYAELMEFDTVPVLEDHIRDGEAGRKFLVLGTGVSAETFQPLYMHRLFEIHSAIAAVNIAIKAVKAGQMELMPLIGPQCDHILCDSGMMMNAYRYMAAISAAGIQAERIAATVAGNEMSMQLRRKHDELERAHYLAAKEFGKDLATAAFDKTTAMKRLEAIKRFPNPMGLEFAEKDGEAINDVWIPAQYAANYHGEVARIHAEATLAPTSDFASEMAADAVPAKKPRKQRKQRA